MVVLAAAQQRCDRGDETRGDREHEGVDERRMERPGDQVREEAAACQLLLPVPAGRLCEHVRSEQRLHRVVAEERGEQGRDRRQVRDARRVGARNAVREEPALERVRQAG